MSVVVKKKKNIYLPSSRKRFKALVSCAVSCALSCAHSLLGLGMFDEKDFSSLCWAKQQTSALYRPPDFPSDHSLRRVSAER